MELVSKPDHDKHGLLKVVSKQSSVELKVLRVQYKDLMDMMSKLSKAETLGSVCRELIKLFFACLKPITWHILAPEEKDHFRLTWSGGVIVDSDSSLPSY